MAIRSSSCSRRILVFSDKIIDALNLSSISVKDNTSSANRSAVQVQLGKGRLLLHHHHGTSTLLHCFKLLFLLSHGLLMGQFDLVVTLQLLLRVTSLQVELDFNIADMRFNLLGLAILGSLCLLGLQISEILAAFFGLELLFFLLLG